MVASVQETTLLTTLLLAGSFSSSSASIYGKQQKPHRIYKLSVRLDLKKKNPTHNILGVLCFFQRWLYLDLDVQRLFEADMHWLLLAAEEEVASSSGRSLEAAEESQRIRGVHSEIKSRLLAAWSNYATVLGGWAAYIRLLKQRCQAASLVVFLPCYSTRE